MANDPTVDGLIRLIKLQSSTTSPATNARTARALMAYGNARTPKKGKGESLLPEGFVLNMGPKGTAVPVNTAGPSVLSRIFDLIQRPSFAIGETIDRIVENAATEKGFGAEFSHLITGPFAGISGREKTSGGKLRQENWPDAFGGNKFAQGLLDFGLSLGIDPITYTPMGWLTAGRRAAMGTKEILKDVGEEVSRETVEAAVRVGESASRVAANYPFPIKPGPALPTARIPEPGAAPAPFAPTFTGARGEEMAQQFATGTRERLAQAGIGEEKGFAFAPQTRFRQTGEEVAAEAASRAAGQAGAAGLRQSKIAKAGGIPGPATERNIGDFLATAFGAGRGLNPQRAEQAAQIARPVYRQLDETENAIVDTVINSTLKQGDTLDPKAQAGIFTSIRNRLPTVTGKGAKKENARQAAAAMDLTRQVVFRLEDMGAKFVGRDGQPLKMPDVFDDMDRMGLPGVDVPGISPPGSAEDFVASFAKGDNLSVNRAEAMRSAVEATKAAPVVTRNAKQSFITSQIANQVVNPNNKKEFDEIMARMAAMRTEVATGSPTAARMAHDLVRQTISDADGVAATVAQKNAARMLKNAINKRVDPILQKHLDSGLLDELGLDLAKLKGRIGEEGKFADTLIGRIAIWQGAKHLRPYYADELYGAINLSRHWTNVWRGPVKAHTTDEWREAFKVAQGRTASTDPKILGLSQKIERDLNQLISNTGLGDNAGTMAARMGLMMDDLNKELKRLGSPFQFRDKKIMDDLTGKELDFTGQDWLKSWQSFDVDDPVQFMYNMQLATRTLAAKYTFFQDSSMRFGKIGKGGIHTHQVKDVGGALHPRLAGVFFPESMAKQMEAIIKQMDQQWHPNGPMMRHIAATTRLWKAGVTKYAPSHHIRNFIGDTWLSWMAGVNSLKPYRQATRILYAKKGRYNDLEDVENLAGRDAIHRASTRPGDVTNVNKAGLEFTADEMWIAAVNYGIMPEPNLLEDLVAIHGKLPKFYEWEPLGGRGQRIANTVTSQRDHFSRMAHFADRINKSTGKDKRRIFEDAAHEVRKWHPDGTELTQLESKARLLIPFYSWTRKSVPLIMESMMLHPAKVMLYPKGMLALQQSLGIDVEGVGDPFPDDQLFPEWMREKGIGPIIQQGGPLGFLAGALRQEPGVQDGYGIINPSNPFQDAVSQMLGSGNFGDIKQGIGSMLNPIGRIPAEVITGHKVLGGIPIESAGDYTTENIPLLSNLSRITNFGITGPTKRAEDEGNFSLQDFLNWLTAGGITGTEPYIKQAEFEEKDRQRKAARALAGQ